LLDLLQHGMDIAGQLRFGDADGTHDLDDSLLSSSLSSSTLLTCP
jgi:hypothetical protein